MTRPLEVATTCACAVTPAPTTTPACAIVYEPRSAWATAALELALDVAASTPAASAAMRIVLCTVLLLGRIRTRCCVRPTLGPARRRRNPGNPHGVGELPQLVAACCELAARADPELPVDARQV